MLQLAWCTTLEHFCRAHHVRSADVITTRLEAIKNVRTLTTDDGIVTPKALLVHAPVAQLRVTLQAIADFAIAFTFRTLFLGSMMVLRGVLSTPWRAPRQGVWGTGGREARWHGMGARGRQKRPFDFPTLPRCTISCRPSAKRFSPSTSEVIARHGNSANHGNTYAMPSGHRCTANDQQRKAGNRERVTKRRPHSHRHGAWFPSHLYRRSTQQRSPPCPQPNDAHKNTLKPTMALENGPTVWALRWPDGE